MDWRGLGTLGLLVCLAPACQVTPSFRAESPEVLSIGRHPLRIEAGPEVPAHWLEVARGALLSRGVWVEPPVRDQVWLPREVRFALGRENRPIGTFQGRPFEADDVPFLALFAEDEASRRPWTQRFPARVEPLAGAREAHAPLYRQETLDHLARRALATGLRHLTWPVSRPPSNVRVLRVALLLPRDAESPERLLSRIEERLRLANTWLEHRVGLRLLVSTRESWPDDDPGPLDERFQSFRRRPVPEGCDLLLGWSFERAETRDSHLGFAAVFGQHLLMQTSAEAGDAEDLDVVREGTALLHELGHVFGLVHEEGGLMTAVRRELTLEPTQPSLELWRLMRKRPFPFRFDEAREVLDLERIAELYRTWSGGDETQVATQCWFWEGSGHDPRDHEHRHPAVELVGVTDARHSSH